MPMESRERVIRAIEMKGPDRLPVVHSTLPGSFLKYGRELEELYAKYPSEILSFGYSVSEEYGTELSNIAKDRWGAVWRRATDNFKGQVVKHPLSDWEALHTYHFPDPLNWPEFPIAEEAMRADSGRHYILVDGDTLWQRMFYLRGMEKVFVDLLRDVEEIHLLRDNILNYILQRVEKWASLGVDGISFRDDWGTQDRMMIQPSLWREFFKLAYRQIFNAAHAGGLHVHFHSDGMISPIIPDLVELGADALNIQLPLFDIDDLRREFGGRVCFTAGLDRQRILPRGSVEEVKAHARQIMAAFGTFRGGYVGGGEVGPDVPLENVEAMLRTFWQHKY